MTKSATIRWKLRSSKNFLSARYLNAPPVLGARLASGVTGRSPQVVETVARWVFAGSSFSVGLEIFPSSLGTGSCAFGQPAGVAAADSAPLSDGWSVRPPPPQPAT